MNSKTTLSVTEARKKIFDIINAVQTTGVFYTLTEKGRPKAIILSAEEFESWEETLKVMKDFPNLEKEMKQAEKEYKLGDFITLESLLVQEGFLVADKARKKYAARIEHTRYSTKKNKKNRR